jgi:hypothetical protein
MSENVTKTSYGKRPLWQWIAIYLVVGAIIYGLIYYFFIANRGGSNPYGALRQDVQLGIS